uniref:TGF_BETA_2 domain-containing protein n=1 Tax=Haemonchus contortus TaxID=6289 RepID=A0A7I4YUJ4_HAECO|nr:Transforming growth factor beta (TGFb) and Transforming growth factor beta domain containing protein [Haemonchus contortus]
MAARVCSVVFNILAISAVVSAKGLTLVQEGQKQTFAYSLEEIPTASFEEHFLDILELDEPPPLSTRRKRSNRVATFMKQLYDELEEDIERYDSNHLGVDGEWSSADRIISVSPKESRLSNGLIAVTFDRGDFPDTVPPELIAAQLRIFLPKDFSVAKVYILNNVTGALSLIDSTIATSQETTVWFNITQMVSNWMQGLSNPTLFIGVEDGTDTPLSKVEVESFVIASFMDERTHIPLLRTRTRRDVNSGPSISAPRDRKSVRTNPFMVAREDVEGCHVQNLYLNFADIGWREWVIAPEGYSTNFCAGACSSDSPMHSKMNATNHAIVQTLVHLLDPKRAEEAKCAPIQLSPTKILFIDNHGNVVMRRYQDMTVQECGCL